MSRYMAIEHIKACKAFAAVWTSEWLLLGMDSFVTGEMLFSSETLIAESARERGVQRSDRGCWHDNQRICLCSLYNMRYGCVNACKNVRS